MSRHRSSKELRAIFAKLRGHQLPTPPLVSLAGLAHATAPRIPTSPDPDRTRYAVGHEFRAKPDQDAIAAYDYQEHDSYDSSQQRLHLASFLTNLGRDTSRDVGDLVAMAQSGTDMDFVLRELRHRLVSSGYSIHDGDHAFCVYQYHPRSIAKDLHAAKKHANPRLHASLLAEYWRTQDAALERLLFEQGGG